MTDAIPAEDRLPARRALKRQLLRLVLYYIGVALALAALNAVIPNFFEHLPIGGVSAIDGSDPATLALEDALLSGDEDVVDEWVADGVVVESQFADAKALTLAMLGTIVVMLPV
ncbi:MAG: hypothetical protein AAGH76_08400 [Pseudomonadota bacterium]